jgi:hypothetical protein
VDVPGLLNVYLVFHALLLKPFNIRGLILYLNTLITDTLRSYSNNVYEVEELIDRRFNNDDT